MQDTPTITIPTRAPEDVARVFEIANALAALRTIDSSIDYAFQRIRREPIGDIIIDDIDMLNAALEHAEEASLRIMRTPEFKRLLDAAPLYRCLGAP